MRRALIVVLLGLVVAGAAAVTWRAMGKAKLVEEDLTTARALLARAGGFESGELKPLHGRSPERRPCGEELHERRDTAVHLGRRCSKLETTPREAGCSGQPPGLLTVFTSRAKPRSTQ